MNKVDLKILTTRKQYLRVVGQLDQLLKEKQFRNGAMVIEKEKCRINLNKPKYVGTSILDLSKVLMQDLQYNYIKNKYDGKADMLLTDTGSLMYKIEDENVYEDFYENNRLTSVITQKIQNTKIMEII